MTDTIDVNPVRKRKPPPAPSVRGVLKEAVPVQEKTFIQCHDDAEKGDSSVHLLATESSGQSPALSFVITRTGEATYFGQLAAAALWLNRTAQKRFEPAAVEALHRIERGEMQNEAFFRLSQYHRCEIMVERRHFGPLSAPMTRPQAGSRWQVASAAEASEYLALPQDGHGSGHIAGIVTREGGTIDIRLTDEHLCHHIISAGATGSGKSNTNVNILLAAQGAYFCSLVYDMKPDYCEIDQPNDEKLAGAIMAAGLSDVVYWSLGVDNRRAGETPISVPAHELDPAKLAQVIFYRPGEEMQQEVAEQLLMGFAHNQENAGKPAWTMLDFTAWLSSAAMATAGAAGAQMPFPAVFNQQTYNAVRSKITRPGRIPSWIDAVAHQRGRPLGGAFGGGRAGKEQDATRMFADLRPRQVHVIRVRAEGDGRSYALFLDYAMRKVAALRRDQSETTPSILHLIDEAADIFKSSNRRLAQAMEGTVDEQVRKGRSLGIGFVLSSQSAGDIPERIRHNLNSVIIFRHRQPKVLQEILPEMTESTRQIASRLQPGEALVQLFKTNGLSRCRMWQSPAKLHKPQRSQASPF
jgi:hypothetical protein